MIVSPFWWEELGMKDVLSCLIGACLRLAFLQPSRRCLALVRMVIVESDACCHNLRFLPFQMLHIMVKMYSIWPADSFCNKSKMISSALSIWFRDNSQLVCFVSPFIFLYFIWINEPSWMIKTCCFFFFAEECFSISFSTSYFVAR